MKVGRAPLDEHAIKWIEENNPDIDFDWPRILEAKPPAAPLPDDPRVRRARRGTAERRNPAPQAATTPSPPQVEPELPEPDELKGTDPVASDPTAIVVVGPDAVEGSTDRVQLTRLRARYAEMLARISERGGDSERIAALRAQAEPLNPDTWVTDEDTRNGIAGFEQRMQDLRASLGLHRRRRSRRGGRRRRSGGSTGGAPPTETPPNPS